MPKYNNQFCNLNSFDFKRKKKHNTSLSMLYQFSLDTFNFVKLNSKLIHVSHFYLIYSIYTKFTH